MRRLPKNILFFGVGLSLIIPKVFACGLEWAVPVTHFDGVEEHGYVCVSEKIGEVDFGDDLKLPLIINFRSDRNTSSPYLGKGWILALLDSNFVQFDENTFYMTQPDGWINRFQRDPKNPTLLGGSGGWKAEIIGDKITAWAICGWKITFLKGKISSIRTPKNRNIVFNYKDDKVIEVSEEGLAILKNEFDPISGILTAIIFNEKRLSISQGNKPRVERVHTQNVISGIDQSFQQSSSSGISSHQYEFAVTEKTNPTMRVKADGVEIFNFSWDSESRQIISDGNWVYTIEGAANAGMAVTRTNPTKGREFWSNNDATGVETSIGIDKVKRIRERFTTGILSGMTRLNSTENSEGAVHLQKYFYDEAGRLRRISENNNSVNTSESIFDEKGEGVEIATMPHSTQMRLYDKNRNLIGVKSVKVKK